MSSGRHLTPAFTTAVCNAAHLASSSFRRACIEHRVLFALSHGLSFFLMGSGRYMSAVTSERNALRLVRRLGVCPPAALQ